MFICKQSILQTINIALLSLNNAAYKVTEVWCFCFRLFSGVMLTKHTSKPWLSIIYWYLLLPPTGENWFLVDNCISAKHEWLVLFSFHLLIFSKTKNCIFSLSVPWTESGALNMLSRNSTTEPYPSTILYFEITDDDL